MNEEGEVAPWKTRASARLILRSMEGFAGCRGVRCEVLFAPAYSSYLHNEMP